MSLFWNDVAEINRAWCAAQGLPSEVYRAPGSTNDAVRKATAVHESRRTNMSDQAYESMARGTYRDTALASPPARLPADYPEDTTAEDTALEWLRRCQQSESHAADVLCELEITEHGEFVQKAMHLLSHIGPYTDRAKIVNDLQDALLDTLKLCAANE